MGNFVRVTGTTDVQPGQGIVAEVSGKTLAVFNVDGAFHAIDNTCIHRGGPLGEGDLEGSVVPVPGTAGNTMLPQAYAWRIPQRKLKSTKCRSTAPM